MLARKEMADADITSNLVLGSAKVRFRHEKNGVAEKKWSTCPVIKDGFAQIYRY